MEDPKAVHTPAATVQYVFFHKKTMRQHSEEILYPKRKALLHHIEPAGSVEHPGLRLTVMATESAHPMKAVELQLKQRLLYL